MATIKKHKVKIIAAVVIVVALVVAWSYGETPVTGGENMPPTLALAENDESNQNDNGENGQNGTGENSQGEPYENGIYENGQGNNDANAQDENELDENAEDGTDTYNQGTSDELNQNDEEASAQSSDSGEALTQSGGQNQTETSSANENAGASQAEANTGNAANQINEDGSFTVTLSVRVDTILPNMHILNVEKHELIPDNGVIFATRQVTAYEGESVFNVLQREMRRNGIHMASRFTPVFNSAYVEAINNIYEFDVGPLSGWMYRVNGVFPNFGSSRYILSPGDVIEWLYTVDLGRDIGGFDASSGQRGE